MKILIPANLFYPSTLGGPANAVYWLARGFASDLHSVTVITTNVSVSNSWIKPDEWKFFDGLSVKYCSGHLKFSWRLIVESLKQLRRNDIVLLGSIFYFPLLPVAICSLILKKKLIWSPRGELFDSAINNNKLKLAYLKFLKWVLSRRVIFHATSEAEALTVRTHMGNNAQIRVIPNYMVLPDRAQRSESHPQYLLYMGRLAPIKAIDRLLLGLMCSDAFMKSDMVLKIAGPRDGDYYQELYSIVEQNENLRNKVEFLGNIVGDAKYKLYADAYAVVLPSHSENFGNVVVESLSQGTPVIASKGTPWEVLYKSGAGYWVNNTPEAIGQAIDDMIKIPPVDYMKMREKALMLSSRFDVFQHMSEWHAIIES